MAQKQKKSGNEKQMFIKVREQLLSILGYHCQRCGYHEFGSALIFHHRSGKKWGEPLIGRLLRRFVLAPSMQNWERVLDAANNCALLCTNCHQSLRAGDWALNPVEAQVKNQ